MIRFYILLFLFFGSITLAAITPWSEEDKLKLESGELIVGSGLFSEKVDIGEDLTFEPLSDKEQESIDTPLIARPIPIDPRDRETPAIDDNRKLISPQLATRYFENRIKQGIIDPQNLLSNKERLDIEYSLTSYTNESESPISLYFYLFDSNQQVPLDYSPRTVFNTHYYSEPAAVVIYYFIAEPERSQIFFGGKDSNLIAKNKIRELESSIKLAAKQKSNKISQLEEFIRQMSLQMYWIERAMTTGDYEPLDSQHAKSKSSAKKNPVTDKVYQGLSLFSRHWWIIVASSLALIALLLAGVYWVANRRFLFPPLDIPSRLSLPNGGHSGGILKYSNEKLPPSAQREQFDEPF